MHRGQALFFAFASVLVVAYATYQASLEGTLAEPRVPCEPHPTLSILASRLVPGPSVSLALQNAGAEDARVFVNTLEADSYRLRVDGRLRPLGGVSIDYDYGPEYAGHLVPAGGLARLTEIHLPDDEGRYLLVARVGDVCGEARLG